ncbi:MAG TPA: MFS transporter [Planctomycetota bacterium]|nr:MFS transporter [Planctomycetota bacterium]
MSPSSAPLVSRYTYRLHAQAAVLEGILAGVLVTYDVVARKTLGASQFQLVILTMAPGSSWLLSLFFANQFQGYDRRSLFLWAGLVGRLPLFAVAWMHGVWPFLAVLVLHGFVQTALIPAQNALYQQNYDAQSRGRLFGRASVWGCAATAVTALGSGLLMDMQPLSSDWLGWLVGRDAFRWLYPAAGIAGLGACLVYGSIRLRKSGRSAPHAPIEAAAMRYWPPHEVVLPPFRRAFEAIRTTLIQDAGFRRFEVALFVYGLGFMVMQPVFAVLFVDELHMKYSDASLAKGVVFYVVNVAALAAAGRMYDRLGLERLGARATVLLAVFATAMAFVQTPAQAVAAFSLFGLAMAALNIAWSMGPIHYAPPGQAARYMSVHVALVGLRALLGHPLGGVVAHGAGSTRPAFVVAAGLFGIATVLMMRAERLSPRRKAAA